MPQKSLNHIAFADWFGRHVEYYIIDGDIYRACSENDLDEDGYRMCAGYILSVAHFLADTTERYECLFGKDAYKAIRQALCCDPAIEAK